MLKASVISSIISSLLTVFVGGCSFQQLDYGRYYQSSTDVASKKDEVSSLSPSPQLGKDWENEKERLIQENKALKQSQQNLRAEVAEINLKSKTILILVIFGGCLLIAISWVLGRHGRGKISQTMRQKLALPSRFRRYSQRSQANAEKSIPADRPTQHGTSPSRPMRPSSPEMSPLKVSTSYPERDSSSHRYVKPLTDSSEVLPKSPVGQQLTSSTSTASSRKSDSKIDVASIYNNNPSLLESHYSIIKVSENQSSIEARRLGKPVQPIFEKSRSGNYWVLTSSRNTEICLVPKEQIKFNEYNIDTARSLFDFDDELAQHSHDFILEKPAKVVSHANTWVLVERGTIAFQ